MENNNIEAVEDELQAELAGGEDNDEEERSVDGEEEEEEEEDDITVEDVLATVLLQCYEDPEEQKPVISYVPDSPTELDPCTIFRLLLEKSVMWFDLFNFLRVDFNTLVKLKKQYPANPQVCLYKAILVWVRGKDPLPSWKALADVLRFKLLEADVANAISSHHFTEEEKKEEEEYLKGVPGGIIPPQFDDDDEEFASLMSNISKELGNEAMAEVYFCLKQLMGASMGRFLDHTCFPETLTTLDALFVPLMDLNLISSQDVDLLVTILVTIGRKDLLPLVETYCSKATLCHSVFKAVKDTAHFFSLRLDVDPDVCVDLDLQTVSLIKRDICRHLGVERIPYLLQFVGWRRVPLIVQFQVHFSLVDRLLELARNPTCPLDKYVRMDMDVRGSIFNFHFKNDRTS